MTWNSTRHVEPSQKAPKSVGMREHLDMPILSNISLLAVEVLLTLCVIKQGLKKRKKMLKEIGFSSKCWGLTREFFYESDMKLT